MYHVVLTLQSAQERERGKKEAVPLLLATGRSRGGEEERRHSIRRASRGRTEVGQIEEENEGEKALLRTYTSTKHVTESLFCFPIKHI